jgi:hypothetical protein
MNLTQLESVIIWHVVSSLFVKAVESLFREQQMWWYWVVWSSCQKCQVLPPFWQWKQILIRNTSLLPLYTVNIAWYTQSITIHILFLHVYIMYINTAFLSSSRLFYLQNIACCNTDNPTTACNCGISEYSLLQPSSGDDCQPNLGQDTSVDSQ